MKRVWKAIKDILLSQLPAMTWSVSMNNLSAFGCCFCTTVSYLSVTRTSAQHTHIRASSRSLCVFLSLFVFPLLISSLCPSSQHKHRKKSSFWSNQIFLLLLLVLRLWLLKSVSCQTLAWTDGAPALTRIHKTTVINYESKEAGAKSSGCH